jgi:glutaminyl-peptide cyclotransferase
VLDRVFWLETRGMNGVGGKYLRQNSVRFGLFQPIALWLAIRASAAPVEGYRIITQYPHSTASYTEGFFYLNGLFLEGTGLEGRSAAFAIRPEPGRPVLQHQLSQNSLEKG